MTQTIFGDTYNILLTIYEVLKFFLSYEILGNKNFDFRKKRKFGVFTVLLAGNIFV